MSKPKTTKLNLKPLDPDVRRKLRLRNERDRALKEVGDFLESCSGNEAEYHHLYGVYFGLDRALKIMLGFTEQQLDMVGPHYETISDIKKEAQKNVQAKREQNTR